MLRTRELAQSTDARSLMSGPADPSGSAGQRTVLGRGTLRVPHLVLSSLWSSVLRTLDQRRTDEVGSGRVVGSGVVKVKQGGRFKVSFAKACVASLLRTRPRALARRVLGGNPWDRTPFGGPSLRIPAPDPSGSTTPPDRLKST